MMPRRMIPATAADAYALLTPRIGIDTTSASQNRTLSTIADPSPAVARAKPASGPGTPDTVNSR